MFGFGKMFIINPFIYIIQQVLTTAKLMKTGQTISYRTGDDGDIEAGRDVSFTVLAENNPFGNTNRFTDELGGQTYTNNWVIDWSTFNNSNVLGYYKVLQGGDTWENSITNSLGTFGTFSGCRLVNVNEILNLANRGVGVRVLNYAPFTFNTSFSIWTSTDRGDGVTALAFIHDNGVLQTQAGRSTPYKYMPCRTFTVSGTTLS